MVQLQMRLAPFFLSIFNVVGLMRSLGSALMPKTPEQVQFNHPTASSIVPFDAKKMLRLEDGLEEFAPLGPVRVIRGLLSSPSFSPISVSVYTRTRQLTDIHLKPVDHLLEAQDGSHTIANYEYNLTQLAAPLNPFNPNRRTVIVIPGYLSGQRVQWMHHIKRSWLRLEDVNVVLVHWPGGNNGLYSTAVSNVKLVARQITILLYYLSQLNGIDFKSASFRESITLVGHSLGAHVAAFVGQELDGQVGRITGLDPAGPIFDKQKSSDRIDPTDAILVDILHTNGGRMRYMKAGLGFVKMASKKLLSLWEKLKSSSKTELSKSLLTSHSSDDDTAWFGLEHPSGHLDYYANGGSVQPGCNDELHLCDHSRAYEIYMNALEFELMARQLYGAQSDTLQRGLHRLVAFPGADYAQFRSGFSIMRNCPVLITSNRLMSSRARHLAYKQCTVPMDFVAPGPRLKRQLEEEYGLPLSSLEHLPDRPLSEWQAADFEERRLFFETMSKTPLVGEHHLMQIHLDRNQHIDWSKGCRFSCKVDSKEEEDLFSLLDYKHDSLEPIEYDQFYGLCFVLANPNDWRMVPSEIPEESGHEPVAEGEESSSQKGYAGSIYIEVSYNGVSLNNIRFVSAPQNSHCKLNINAIKTRPLTTLAYNVSSWYDNNEGHWWTKSDLKLHSEHGYDKSIPSESFSLNGQLHASFYKATATARGLPINTGHSWKSRLVGLLPG